MTFLVPEFTSEGFEHVSFFHDEKSQLKSIVAIHSTKLGPSLGGCRFYPYASTDAALKDVMRLAQAMTYKAAVADLPLGGGKAIIIGDAKTEKTDEKLMAFGRYIDRLRGTYITTVDSGTTPDDMVKIQTQTSHVVGIPSNRGGSDDPSPNTALGVFEGIKACLQFHSGSSDLKGKRIAIQGIGNVGLRLAKLLAQAGAKLAIADVVTDRVKQVAQELSAEAFTTDSIFDTPCDVFAPCAMGAVISHESVARIQAPIIAGAANNQLVDHSVSETIMKRGMLYAPDFVINAGGLIHVTLDLKIFSMDEVVAKTEKIHHTILEILDRSKKKQQSTQAIAIELAKEKLH